MRFAQIITGIFLLLSASLTACGTDLPPVEEQQAQETSLLTPDEHGQETFPPGAQGPRGTGQEQDPRSALCRDGRALHPDNGLRERGGVFPQRARHSEGPT